jgi:hypothetical protein
MTKLSDLRELLAKATSRYDDEVIKEFMPEADLLLDLWEACDGLIRESDHDYYCAVNNYPYNEECTCERDEIKTVLEKLNSGE